MTLPKSENRELLERLIFEEQIPEDWARDVWDMSPTLGETAAKLVDGFAAVIECCSDEKLDNLVRSLYRNQLEE